MIKKKIVKVILIMKVPEEFYLPAFTGAIQGYLNGIKVLQASDEIEKIEEVLPGNCKCTKCYGWKNDICNHCGELVYKRDEKVCTCDEDYTHECPKHGLKYRGF